MLLNQSMAWSLTEDALALLLKRLDDDRERAGEKYEDLRRMLLRFFEWRGASFCEERADETLNRLARKLTEGLNLQDPRAYAMQVARLVLLESYKSRDARRAEWDELPQEPSVDPLREMSDRDLTERNQRCLIRCLQLLPDDARQLILAYYQHTGRAQIEYRAALALQLGLRREALANRVQRLRDRLTECVLRCINQN